MPVPVVRKFLYWHRRQGGDCKHVRRNGNDSEGSCCTSLR